MGYDEDGNIFAEPLDGLHNSMLRFIIERARRFVQNDDIGSLVERTRNADSLALATGQTNAAFPNEGLVLHGPAFDQIADLSLARRPTNALVVDPLDGQTKRYVLLDGAVG
jgi:hypothetical protein